MVGMHAFFFGAPAFDPSINFNVDPSIFTYNEPFEDVVEAQSKVPILMYHYVRDIDINYDQIGWNLSISPEDFEKQLQYLSDNNYQTIHLEDLLDGTVPEKSVVLTFDDGLSDFYTTALPLLQKYEMTASNSIITGMVGDGNHMTIQEIQECLDAGIEITAHTVTHPNLSALSEEDVRAQIEESRAYLESTFGIDLDAFVYPSGKYNDDVVALLNEAGFEVAATTQFGVADLESDNMLTLPRIRIDNRDGYEGFVKKIEEAGL